MPKETRSPQGGEGRNSDREFSQHETPSGGLRRRLDTVRAQLHRVRSIGAGKSRRETSGNGVLEKTGETRESMDLATARGILQQFVAIDESALIDPTQPEIISGHSNDEIRDAARTVARNLMDTHTHERTPEGLYYWAYPLRKDRLGEK